MSLDENLDRVAARYEELGHALANQGAQGSQDFVRMSKEYAGLTQVVAAIENLQHVGPPDPATNFINQCQTCNKPLLKVPNTY